MNTKFDYHTILGIASLFVLRRSIASKGWFVALLVLLMTACTINGSEVTGSVSGDATANIEALQIDGTWIFQHDPEATMDALHSGTPEIVDGCLVIDDTVVVWPPDRIEEAAAAIEAAKAGQSPQLLVPGGGVSVNEGADSSQIPSIITERCPTSAVWYAAPRGPAQDPDQASSTPPASQPDANLGILIEEVTSDGRLIYLPVQPPSETSMTSLLEGTLVEVNGCLRIEDDQYPEGWLVLWPSGSRIQMDGESIEVTNEEGQAIAQVGERLRAAGGAAEFLHGLAGYDEMILGMPLDGCPGPYWVAAPLESMAEQHVPDIYFEPFSTGDQVRVWYVSQSRPSPETEILSGKLALDEAGCLRLEEYLLILPPEKYLRENPLRIVDQEQNEIAQIGNLIQVTGAEKYSDDYRYFDNKVRCSGPYWGVNQISAAAAPTIQPTIEPTAELGVETAPIALARQLIEQVDSAAPESWQAAPCEGEAAVLCISDGQENVGYAELLIYPLSRFPENHSVRLAAEELLVSPSAYTAAHEAAIHQALTALADEYLVSIAADRAITNPDDTFMSLPAETAQMGDLPAFSFGFVHTNEAAVVVERYLNVAAFDGNFIYWFSIYYDPANVSSFVSDTAVTRFAPFFLQTAANMPIHPAPVSQIS